MARMQWYKCVVVWPLCPSPIPCSHTSSLSLSLSLSLASHTLHTLHTHYALTPFSFSHRVSPYNIRYQEFVGDHKPARAVVPVPHLHYGFQLELEAVAML